MKTATNKIPYKAYILGIIWLVTLILLSFEISKNFLQTGIALFTFTAFSAWGHVVAYPLFYGKKRTLEGFIWGTISGTAIASLATSVFVYCIGWNLAAIFTAITVLPALIFLIILTRIRRDSKSEAASDVDILLFALLITTLFLFFPFKNIGSLIGDKYVYAWLFGHDFINRLVHVMSLSNGLPLESFYFSGEHLNYYWLAYIYPALLHKITWIKLDITQIMLLTELFYALLAVSAVFLFLKKFRLQRKLLVLLIALVTVAYSYSGLYNVAMKIWKVLMGETQLRIFGYNFSIFSGATHTHYRFFLVEPQATLALAVMLMIFTLYDRNARLYEIALLGLLLGLLFGIDATNGIMLFLWFGCTSLFYWILQKEDRMAFGGKFLLSLSCTAIIYLILFCLHMYSFGTGKGVLQLSLNWFGILFSGAYFPIEYGPVFFLGVAGLIKLIKKKETITHWGYPFVILMVISLFFVFFITSPTESQFGLLKATRIIPLSLLAFTAYFLQHGFRTRISKVIVTVLVVLGLPSVFVDNLIASDISKPSTYIRRPDMEAAVWIKNNLPKQAIIQAEPNHPGIEIGYEPKYYYSLIPIFAERRTVMGEWKVSSQAHSQTDMVGERFHSIKKMFSTSDLREAIEIIKKYSIEYVYLGELEKRLYPDGIIKFFNKEYFEQAYWKDGVYIVKLKSSRITYHE